MSSISQFLPDPKHSKAIERSQDEPEPVAPSESQAVTLRNATAPIPPYGKRKGWVPKTASDFGDGGAYPEIHVAQYPLGMGRKRSKKSNALSKQVDSDGNTRYDAIAQHGRRENEIVQSQFKDLIPLRQRKDFNEEDAIPERPDQETVRETTERTKKALEKLVGGKVKGGSAKTAGKGSEPSFVRYTPSQQGGGFNSGASQRIVRVSEMPVDPFEPPKFKHRRGPEAPPEKPAPVMHSPPRKLTAEEQKEWVIPPCVSNWKNIHGFTVSLDKRLATEGRGLEQLDVSDNFAKLSEALISAERNAREEISMRANIQQNLARKEKEAKEERLRMLAQRAREERAAAAGNRQQMEFEEPRLRTPVRDMTPESRHSRSPSVSPHRINRPSAASFFNDKSRSPSPVQRTRQSRYEDSGDEKHEPRKRSRSRSRSRSPAQRASRSRYEDSDDEKEAARARKRDELRRELRKQNERDLRLSRMGNSAKAKYLRKHESRDISEKIALGMAKPTASREGMFDSRLFNQPSASNAVLQDEEAYNLYDKPLFNAKGRGDSSYRPRAVEDENKAAAEVDRLMSSDRFGNTLHGLKGSSKDSSLRSEPVKFEKGDVFGIEAFADKAKQSKN